MQYCCIYIYIYICFDLTQYAHLVIATMDLWKLIHLDTPKHGNILLACENPNTDQVISRVTNIMNMKEECRFKKHRKCSKLRKTG